MWGRSAAVNAFVELKHHVRANARLAKQLSVRPAYERGAAQTYALSPLYAHCRWFHGSRRELTPPPPLQPTPCHADSGAVELGPHPSRRRHWPPRVASNRRDRVSWSETDMSTSVAPCATPAARTDCRSSASSYCLIAKSVVMFT